LFRYYLLGGDTVVPSRLLARLCHAFLVLIFLMISRRQIISGSSGLIFTIFSLNESVLGADDRPGPLFSIPQGTLPWQPILWQNYLPLLHLLFWHSVTEWDNAIYMYD